MFNKIYNGNSVAIFTHVAKYAVGGLMDIRETIPGELESELQTAFNVMVTSVAQNHGLQVVNRDNEAFIKTNTKKEGFKVTKWGKDKYGKSFPVEWRASNGAEVNVDLGHTSVGPTGPRYPHIGYQTGGKRRNKEDVRGHILLEDIPGVGKTNLA